MSSEEPFSTCHVQPPSHLPVVGSALKLHGQPQSQLHATRTCPVTCHRSAIITPRVLPGWIFARHPPSSQAVSSSSAGDPSFAVARSAAPPHPSDTASP